MPALVSASVFPGSAAIRSAPVRIEHRVDPVNKKTYHQSGIASIEKIRKWESSEQQSIVLAEEVQKRFDRMKTQQQSGHDNQVR
jgi:hypothetical protein